MNQVEGVATAAAGTYIIFFNGDPCPIDIQVHMQKFSDAPILSVSGIGIESIEHFLQYLGSGSYLRKNSVTVSRISIVI